jgi:hypothetical protein
MDQPKNMIQPRSEETTLHPGIKNVSMRDNMPWKGGTMRKKFSIIVVLAILVSIVSMPACQRQDKSVTYPVTRKADQMDDYFGTQVPDPYRWLEDDRAEEVKSWVQEQNKVTFAYLEKIPFREKIRQRLREIYNYPRYSLPSRAGEYYFFSKNDGLEFRKCSSIPMPCLKTAQSGSIWRVFPGITNMRPFPVRKPDQIGES